MHCFSLSTTFQGEWIHTGGHPTTKHNNQEIIQRTVSTWNFNNMIKQWSESNFRKAPQFAIQTVNQALINLFASMICCLC